MKMRKLIQTAALLFAVVFFAVPCTAVDCSADCAIVIDADTGAVLYEKQADTRSLIASTTKIMTAVVALEHCDPDAEFVIPSEATNIEGSSIYLQAGQIVSVRELLYGMLLSSGNDAAVALALACSGSVDEFVVQMNLKAQKLGLENTSFENPSGLDGERHFSTARDLAVLTAYALKNELFRQIVSTQSIAFDQRVFTNHNRLLWTLDGAIGVKTGYTRAAGRVLVSAAERNGRCLIAVTIRDGNDWEDHRRLYEAAFENYTERVLVSQGQPVTRIALMDGTIATLLSDDEVKCYAADDEQVTLRLLYPRQAFCADERGTFAGSAAVYLGDRRVATIRLLWGNTEGTNDSAITENSIRTWSGLPSCG